MVNIQEIEFLANGFRTALDKASQLRAFGYEHPFVNFPRECCDDVCDLFGQMLFENGIGVSKIFGRYRYDNWEHNYSHVWLQLEDGTIIDLTGDQYRYDPIMLNYNIPCYVGKPDQLHRLFQNDELRCEPFYGIDSYGEPTTPRLWKLYDIVLGFFEKN